MREDLVEILRCPVDKGTLSLHVAARNDDDSEVMEGTLTCTECSHAYQIKQGIPNLLPPELQKEIEEELGRRP